MTTQIPQAQQHGRFGRWLFAAALAGALASGCSNGKAKEKDADEDKATTVPVETQASEARRDAGRLFRHGAD